MNEKVDIIINVYGKPWQTLSTLKSLMQHSGNHIDKIYFIEESEQPYNDNVDWIKEYFNNLIVYKPIKYSFWTSNIDNYSDKDSRYTIRYQYGIENSDKKHVLITHNDVLYEEDIVKLFLDLVEDNVVGIGEVGICWNCPAFNNKLCNWNKFQDYNPTYEEALKLIPFNDRFDKLLNKNQPMPMPSCRLNEWTSFINRDIVMKECQPNGVSSPFGLYNNIDLGLSWFRDMWLKGYKFKHNRKGYTHTYWSNNRTPGYNVQIKEDLYKETELAAKKYFKENYK